MTTRLDGVSVLAPLRWRRWDGVIADVWHAQTADGARGEYVSRHPRVFIILEKEGGDIDLRLSPRAANLPALRGSHVSFVPAELEIWSRTETGMRLRHLDLHLDVEVLARRLGHRIDAARLAAPRLMFADARIMDLARLIAAECGGPNARDDLYGDALTLALTTELFQVSRDRPRKRPALAAWQLRRSIAFIEDNCMRNVRLQELAELTQLSQTYFSHAFKTATGVPPSRWHMRARIRKVQTLLAGGDMSLTDIAMSVGFADQAHFTRVFRRMVGQTPSAWRLAHRR
jgi:AraC-like DNA-binding protein